MPYTKLISLYEYNNKIKQIEKNLNCQDMEKNKWKEEKKVNGRTK